MFLVRESRNFPFPPKYIDIGFSGRQPFLMPGKLLSFRGDILRLVLTLSRWSNEGRPFLSEILLSIWNRIFTKKSHVATNAILLKSTFTFVDVEARKAL